MKMSLKTKLALGFGMLLAFLVAGTCLNFVTATRLMSFSNEASHDLRKKELAVSTEVSVRRQIAAANDYTFTGEAEALQRYEQSKVQHAKVLDDLTKSLAGEEEKSLLSKIREDESQVFSLADQQIKLRRESRNFEAVDLATGPKVRAAMQELSADLVRLGQLEETLAQNGLDAEHSGEVKSHRITLFLVICGVLIGVLTAVLTTRSITTSMSQMLAVIREISSNNLAVDDLNIVCADEIGEACKALNKMKRQLRGMISEIAGDAERVTSASEEISSAATQSAESSRAQADQTHQVATAVQEMSSTVQQVSENSQKASEASHKAAQAARQGGEVVEETLATMRSIADSTKNVAARVAELGKSSEQIGKIIAVIDDIADQTNLLALNAAIEAARAGEQGRGFAVVADEVRKLAERTTKATKEIAAMIEAIQVETKNAVQAMELGNRDVQVGVEKTSASGAALEEIIQMSEQVGDMISQIATAASQQSSATEQIATNVSQISSLTQESSSATEQTAKACTDLSSLALDLQKLLGQFKLGQGGSGRRPSHVQVDSVRKQSDKEERRPTKKSKAAAAAH